METQVVQMERVTFVSTKSFNEIFEKLAEAIGHPDIHEFHQSVSEANTISQVEAIVKKAIGSSELMEFARFDSGGIVGKVPNKNGRKILRLLVGNPVIMEEMATTVPDAAAYAPVTILVSERPDGVHLAYDSMASLLASYEDEEALKVARALDVKVKTLLNTIAE